MIDKDNDNAFNQDSNSRRDLDYTIIMRKLIYPNNRK